MNKEAIINSMRVPREIKDQSFGLWTVRRLTAGETVLGEMGLMGFPDMTVLFRLNEKSMHLTTPGEVVMEDSRRELSRHLPVLMEARGRVLVTGLGLGCVVRGLIALDRVHHVDVVEIDPGIIGVIGREFRNNPRVTLHCADALEWDHGGRSWDYAWHDVHCDEGRLPLLHTRLLIRYRPHIKKRQGAWMLPRQMHWKTRGILLGSPRRFKAA